MMDEQGQPLPVRGRAVLNPGFWAVGLVLGLIAFWLGLRRNAARAYAGLALFGLSATAALISASPVFRPLMINSESFWRVARALSEFAGPLGVLAFAEAC